MVEAYPFLHLAQSSSLQQPLSSLVLTVLAVSPPIPILPFVHSEMVQQQVGPSALQSFVNPLHPQSLIVGHFLSAGDK